MHQSKTLANFNRGGYLTLFVIWKLTDISLNISVHSLPGIWTYIIGITGSVATMSLCWLLAKTKLNNPLIFLGKNSLLIMCLHEPLKRIVIKVASSFANMDTDMVRQNLTMSILITFAVVVILLPCIYAANKWMPWLVGKK